VNITLLSKKIYANGLKECIDDACHIQKDEEIEEIENETLCYNNNEERLYLKNESGKCTIPDFSNITVFINDKNKVAKTNTDKIIAGYTCSTDNFCTSVDPERVYNNGNIPEYQVYVSKDNSYKLLKIVKNAVYLTSDSTIATCNQMNPIMDCTMIISSMDGYYVNSEKSNHIIHCNNNVCTSTSAKDGYYLNAGPDKHSNPLIYCKSSSGCTTIDNDDYNYYINAGVSKANTDSIIYCSNANCSIMATTDGQYFVGIKDDKPILISCTSGGCNLLSSASNKGYYKNSGYNNLTYPLIYCSSSSTCAPYTIKEPGYYVDVKNQNNVYYCKNNNCDDSKDISFNYIKANDENALSITGKCYTLENQIYMVGYYLNKEKYMDNIYTKGDVLFYYLKVNTDADFPSIHSATETLFRITPYSITRVVTDGAIVVNDLTHTINPTSADLSTDDSIYLCNKKKMVCEKKNSCSTKMYLLDEISKTGFVCEKNKLEPISAGYYLDGGNKYGSYYRNLIYCTAKYSCMSIISPSNYYINSGRKSTTSADALISCNNGSCTTVSGVTGGYYVAGTDSIDTTSAINGYIYCTSPTACELKKTTGEAFYVNSGQDKSKFSIIKCMNARCQSMVSSNGYFISGNSEELIYCEGSTNCSTIKASTGFYHTAESENDDTKKIIECTASTTVTCLKKNAEKGYYISNTGNTLINCMGSKCKTFRATNGIFRAATTTTTTTNYRRSSSLNERNTQIVYNIITCTNTGCTLLSASELAAIPICTFDNNKCFITNKFSSSNSIVSSIAAGGYCTNLDHSVIYFATDTVVIDTEIIDGTTSIYTTTTTTTNCIEVTSDYSSYFFTVNDSIYRIDDGRIMQETRAGYYFINVETNTLANGMNIDDYNNPNIKLFKCNDNSCYAMDDPINTTYYADVNKRIIQYNAHSNTYNFPYEKDIICIYSNNKCIPNADLNSREFCITYKGELVLAATDIKSRETGDCYKSNSIVSYIFGHSKYLYEMNMNSAQVVDTTGYYIVSLATNSTASYKDYTNRNNIIKIYGCVSTQCKEYMPLEGVFYYDYISRYMYKYENGEWTTPQTSGYALASIVPGDLYIYKFSTNMNKVTLEGKAVSGYYYTVDDEMYDCDENNGCVKISDNGYYFTNNGEMFYCLYDSEGLEKTSCVKQNCYIGEYYYIDGTYYRCESGSIYNYISAKYCNYNERIVVNFPTAINMDFPAEVHNAINSINRHNNSTALVNNKVSNYLTVIPGIFTNCTYNYEDKTTTFDLLCINNYVTLDEDDMAQICSISQLGYVECLEDEGNKEKCNPSLAWAKYTSNLTLIILISMMTYFLFDNIY